GLALAVPEHRNRDAAGIVRVGPDIGLAQELETVDAVASGAIALAEGPAVRPHVMVDDRDGDHVFEPLEGARDQRAVRPRAGIGDVEVIAAWLGGKAARTSRSGRAVGGHPVAKARILAPEASAAFLGIIPDVV